MNAPHGNTVIKHCSEIEVKTPGAIQPHGVLLALDPETTKVSHVSANSGTLLGVKAQEMVGKTLENALPELHKLIFSVVEPGQSFAQANLNGKHFDIAISHTPDKVLVDLEPYSESQASAQSKLAKAFSELLTAQTTEDVLQYGVYHLNQLIGYEHIMMYRFDHNWNGAVIDEYITPERRPFHTRYLGLCFPEGDIPAQARELYKTNWVRVIANVDALPSPLIGENTAALDLSGSGLRAVSNSHIQYLKNMGVHASLSVSIIVDGQLWGLIACHNSSAKQVPALLRNACVLYGQFFSSELSLRQQSDAQRYLDTHKDAHEWPLIAAREGINVITILDDKLELTTRAFSGCGCVFWSEYMQAHWGKIPPASVIQKLTEQLKHKTDTVDIWSSDRLPEALHLSTEESKIAGALVIGIPARDLRYLMIFREEELQEINWGGDPRYVPTLDSNKMLTPRRSFELWRETVRERSRKWREQDLDLARVLSLNLLQAIGIHASIEQTKQKNRQETTNMVLHDLGNAITGLSGETGKLAQRLATHNELDHLDRLTQMLCSKEDALDEALGPGKGAALNRFITEINESLKTLRDEDRSSVKWLQSMLGHAGELLDLQRSYVQSSKPSGRSFQLIDVIQDAVTMTYNAIDRRGKINFDFSGKSPILNTDQSKVLQIIVNLLKNACEAWDQLQVKRNALKINIEIRSDIQGIYLVIADNGCGFDAETEEKMFTLGFSTKERGSGLGLANSKRLAESCGVTLSIASRGSGQGAVSTIFFPKGIFNVFN